MTNVNRRSFLGMLGLAGLASRFTRKAEAQPSLPPMQVVDVPRVELNAGEREALERAIDNLGTPYDNVQLYSPDWGHPPATIADYGVTLRLKRSDVERPQDAEIDRAIRRMWLGEEEA